MKKLFAIGDSISIHYGPYLKQMTDGLFQYSRKGGIEEAMKNLDVPVGANGGSSSIVLKYLLDYQKEIAGNCDVLLLNCGLHDILIDAASGNKRVSQEEYRENLGKILRIAGEICTQVVWVRTTPVIDERHNSQRKDLFRFNRDILEYNDIADEIMSAHCIPVIDLYTFTKNLGPEVYCDQVHFNETTRMLQAAYISGFLERFQLL